MNQTPKAPDDISASENFEQAEQGRSSTHEDSSQTKTRDTDDSIRDEYITGWKFWIILLWLLTSLFIAQMDTSITSTAILNITDQLGSYEKSSWVFSAYMLTYCAFQMIWAKVSDIYGRKATLIAGTVLFTMFSGVCAASQTMVQLILFRAVQGIGGCGVYVLVQTIFFELIPPKKWPQYVSLFTGVLALSLVTAPLIGGAISQAGKWRWVFLLNVPICGVAILGLLVSFPARLFNEAATSNDLPPFSFKSVRRLDLLGSTLLLGACILLSTGLQQAALGYRWTSSFVLPLLVLAVPFAVGFVFWQRFLTRSRTYPEPILPWRLLRSRVCLGLLLNTTFSGAVLMISLVQIPQRFMTVNGLTSFDAAVRLLAFGAFVPGGASIAAGLMGKPKARPSHIILTGSILQLIGSVLLARSSTDSEILASQYGFQILLGAGVGFVSSALILLVPYVVEQRDLAVGTASISQFRTLGGVVGIAIAASISTPYIRRHLQDVIPPKLVYAILEKTENMHLLSDDALQSVRIVFGEAYNIQMKLVMAFAIAQIPSTALMWTNQGIPQS